MTAATTTTTTVSAFELTFTSGSSDKFYRVFTWTDEDGGGHAVVQYGRNGTTGTTKATAYPDLDAAEAFAAKQLKAKRSKGYTDIGSGTFDAAPAALAEAAGSGHALDAMWRGATAAPIAAVAAVDADTKASTARQAERLSSIAASVEATASYTDVVEAIRAAGHKPDRFADMTSGRDPRPQLAETVENSMVERHFGPDRADLGFLIASGSYVAQPKLDGDRMMVVIDGGVAILNRQGQPKTTNITAGVYATFATFATFADAPGRWVFDGEMVGTTLHLFDLAEAGEWVGETTPFETRQAVLAVVVEALRSDAVELVPTTFVESAAKQAMFDEIAASGGEGVIFRHVHAAYSYGRRGAGLIKHKFVHEADCYVAARHPSKSSVTLAVRDADGNEVICGQASTIGKGTLADGDVVEVRFLYVLDPDDPTMVQPRIVRTRTDKAADECHLSQFASTVKGSADA